MAVCNNNDNILSLFYCSFYINKNRSLQNTDNVLSRKSLFTAFFLKNLLRFQNSSNQVVYRNLLLTFEDGSNIILQLCLHISNSQKSTLKPKYLHLITWLPRKPFRCVLLDQIFCCTRFWREQYHHG